MCQYFIKAPVRLRQKSTAVIQESVLRELTLTFLKTFFTFEKKFQTFQKIVAFFFTTHLMKFFNSSNFEFKQTKVL